MKATVSERGQVTIPKALRDRLGIRAGQVLDFDADEGRLVARKEQRGDGLDALLGAADIGISGDEFMRGLRPWIRGRSSVLSVR